MALGNSAQMTHYIGSQQPRSGLAPYVRLIARLQPPAPQLSMRQDEQCKVLCRIQALSAAQAKAFVDKIADDYKVNM